LAVVVTVIFDDSISCLCDQWLSGSSPVVICVYLWLILSCFSWRLWRLGG